MNLLIVFFLFQASWNILPTVSHVCDSSRIAEQRRSINNLECSIKDVRSWDRRLLMRLKEPDRIITLTMIERTKRQCASLIHNSWQVYWNLKTFTYFGEIDRKVMILVAIVNVKATVLIMKLYKAEKLIIRKEFKHERLHSDSLATYRS